MIYETEVDRVTYLLRAYLRARIVKIQSQALFLARDEAAQARLSEPEATFAAQYAALYQRHIDRASWGARAPTPAMARPRLHTISRHLQLLPAIARALLRNAAAYSALPHCAPHC